MSRQQRELQKFHVAVSSDIFKLCAAYNFTPTWQQADLMRAVMEATRKTASNRIACKSGQGPGKTTCSNIVAVWRCLQAVDAMTVVTAPTMRQCRDVFLAEGRRLLERADPLLRKLIKITATRLIIAGRPDWGVKTVTATKEENAQGYHDPNMTVIVEEASGVPRPIITQFKGTLSNPNSLLMQIGNPNTRDCDFFDCFNSSERGRWRCFTFNAEDTARDYPHIVSPQRNEDLAREFGIDSDVYRIRVLGEFPHSDPNCVMSSEDLSACTMECFKLPCAIMGGGAKVIGIDFARYGGDENVVYRRQGNSIVEQWYRSRVDPSEAVKVSFRMQKEAGWKESETFFVADAGGIGQGVMHRFYEKDKQIWEFHNGGRPMETEKYANAITEAWFNLGKLVKARQCYLPDDPTLIRQLATRQYYTNKDGKLILETKDEYMKRGFESPDRADGVVYAFFSGASETTVSDRMRSVRKVGPR